MDIIQLWPKPKLQRVSYWDSLYPEEQMHEVMDGVVRELAWQELGEECLPFIKLSTDQVPPHYQNSKLCQMWDDYLYLDNNASSGNNLSQMYLWNDDEYWYEMLLAFNPDAENKRPGTRHFNLQARHRTYEQFHNGGNPIWYTMVSIAEWQDTSPYPGNATFLVAEDPYICVYDCSPKSCNLGGLRPCQHIKEHAMTFSSSKRDLLACCRGEQV